MLIAEDLLLLIYDLDGGQDAVVRGDIALAGALLADLAHTGRLGVSQAAKGVEPGRLLVLDRTPIGDDVLDAALGHIAAREGELPLDVLPELTEGLRSRLVGELTDRGLLQPPGENGTAAVPSPEALDRVAERRAALRAMLRSGAVTDERARTLLGLLSGADLEDAVLDPDDTTTDADELDRREWTVTDGVWLRDEVAKVVLRAELPASGVSPFIPQL